jgi:hypothetical protein
MPLKRVGIAISVASLAFCGAAAATTLPQKAELRGLQCRRSPEPAGRTVSVTAVMRPVSGTVRMALKFSLERRVPGTGEGFRSVPSRQLGQWVNPANPSLGQNPADVWMLKQNVVNLSAPAAYRFRVWFRWTGANGRVLSRAVRVSPVCYQPDPRPNLSVRSISVTSLGNGQSRYDVLVHNGGNLASGPFTVRLDPPGGQSQSAMSQSLAPRATERESFDAPACTSGDQVTAVADPDGKVADRNRADNTLTVACP